jgi:hypothetical protein
VHPFVSTRGRLLVLSTILLLLALATPFATATDPDLNNGLIAFWKLDEAAGTRYDSSGNGRNLDCVGTVGATTGPFGNTSAALRGTNYLQSTTLTPAFTGQQVTVSLWAKVNTNATQKLCCQWYAGGWLNMEANASGLTCAFGHDGLDQIKQPLSLNTWHHITSSWDGTQIRVTVDGQERTLNRANMPENPPYVTNSVAPFIIGWLPDPFIVVPNVNEDICDVGIWSRALTPAETAELYSNGNGQVYPFTAPTSGETTAVAMVGADATGIEGAKFRAIGHPAMNTLGHTAFEATVTGAQQVEGIAGRSTCGIWADDSTGTRQLVVRSGADAPGIAGAVFSRLGDPAYNNNDQIAFWANLRSVMGGNPSGIWSNSGGSLALVAHTGMQAPGCPRGVKFSSFLRFALPDQGGVVFLAKLSHTTRAADRGIWAVDTNGALQLIVREGQLHPVTGKKITRITFLPTPLFVGGQTRGFNQSTGDLIYEASFSDGSKGIFKVVFP